MSFKGEIALGALNSKYKYGFTVGDIYRVQGAGNLVPNNLAVANGAFVEWTSNGWEVKKDMQYATSETGESLDDVAKVLGMSVSQQYVPGETYEIGAIVTHDGGLYINNYGTISDPDWVEEHWTPTSVGELIVSGMCEADKMQVIAAALNDLDARLKAVEESISSVNIGSRVADELDAQSLKVGGEDINTVIQNAIGG